MALDTTPNSFSFLKGSGEMFDVIRAKDWTKTSLNSPDTWPQSLRTTLSILLHSRVPMFLFWGPDFICFYNDAYRPSLGEGGKHPSMLGAKAKNYWKEVWKDIEPLINNIMAGGEAQLSEDLLLPIFRNGGMEDAYWTFSHSAVIDENEKPAGVLVTLFETTQKVSALKILEEREDQLNFTIDAADIATWNIYPSTNTFTANNRLKEWYGFNDEEEIEVEAALARIDDADQQKVREAMEAAMDPQKKAKFDIVHTINNPLTKKKRYVHAKGKVMFDENNVAISFVGTGQDITNDLVAQQKLSESEEQFHALADNISQLTWMADKDGNRYWFNKRWYDYTGTTEQDMNTTGWHMVHHPDHLERVKQKVKHAVETGQSWEDTYPIKGKDGKYCWFLTRAIPLKDKDGNIERWFGSNTEVTAQKIAEQKTLESEKRFRSLADDAPMWVWLADKELNILYANKIALKFVGVSDFKDYTGKFWEQILHPDDVEQVYSKYQEASENRTSFNFECRIKNSETGLYEWIFLTIAVRYDNEEFAGFIGTAINVQEKKTATEILEYRKALLESNNDASLDGALLVDTNGKIISYNKRFVEIWKMPTKTVTSKNDDAALDFAMEQLVNPQQFINKVKYLYDNPTETSRDELIFKDGKIIERYGYPVIGSDGTYYAWSWIFRDITQQKNDERVIKESEERFRNLISSSPSAIGILNGKDFIITIANDAIFNIWGKGKEILGMPFFKALPELVDQGFKEIFENVYKSGVPYNGVETAVYISHFGEMKLKYFNFLLYAQKNIEGKIDGIGIIATEVTTTALINKQILESEQRFRLMAETLPQLIWVTDEKGSREYASGRWKEYTGLDLEQDGSWEKMVHPEDYETINKVWTESLQTGKIYNYLVRLKNKAGEYRWFAVRGEPVLNAENKIIKWVGAFTDIHTQKTFEQELKKQVETRTKELAALNTSLINKNDSLTISESFNKALTNISPNVVYILDLQVTTPIFLNRTALDVLGYSWEQVLKIKDLLHSHIHPEDILSVKGALYKMKSAKDGEVIEHEYRIKNKAGNWVPFLFRETVFKRNNKNEVSEIMGIGVDITELKRSKNILEQKNIELEKMNQELQSFAYISSHDLQEPLRKIQTFTNYIVESEFSGLSDKGKDYFKRIQNSASRMRQLIEDLLSYSRASDKNIQFEEVQLDEFINDVKAEFLEDINSQHAVIKVNAPCTAKVIPFQFRQLMANLVSNSLKFKKPDEPSVITITSQPAKGNILISDKMVENKDYCHIIFADNGIGFSNSYSSKIFEVFQRLHGKTEYAGTGIGLAIVKKIIENHDGIIMATGELGKGATFNIYLPQ